MADVLVIDDNKVFRDLVAVLLENEGLRVRTAVDGQDALRQIETHGAAAIILDLAMPGLDGYEVLRQIKSRRLAPDAWIVVLTADDDAGRAQTAMSLGASRVVTKPFDADEFASEVQAHLASAPPGPAG